MDLINLKIDEKTLKVRNNEGNQREFKIKFENEKLWQYAKTMAAFANRDGGVIFFGIKDNPKELVGIDGSEPDESVFSNFTKAHFEPEILFEFGIKNYADKKLMYVLVQSSPNKPVICKKEKKKQFREKGIPDEKLLREGAIYYRYSSSTEEIKHPELKKILNSEVQSCFRSLVDNITLINKVGYHKAAIVDASELSGNDKTTSVYVTNETAKKINWIRKGRFSESEKDGERAFYVTKVEIRQGVEIEKPVDPGKTHQLTKAELSEIVKMNYQYLDAILWKMDILNDPTYHLSGNHGRNKWHKFTQSTVDKILKQWPLALVDRNKCLKKVLDEYESTVRRSR